MMLFWEALLLLTSLPLQNWCQGRYWTEQKTMREASTSLSRLGYGGASPDRKKPLIRKKDDPVLIGPKMEIRGVMFGLDGAGKTTILLKLQQDAFLQPIQTLGFNLETVEHNNWDFTFFDVGGMYELRPLWKHYCPDAEAVVFVIDSSRRDRIMEAHCELEKLLTVKEVQDAMLLIFANKQDVPGAVSVEEMTELLDLHKLCHGRSWHIQGCDARTGVGLHEGLVWLAREWRAVRVQDVD